MRIADCRFQIEVGQPFFEELRGKTSGSPGEVVIVAPRPGGKVLLHTKVFYPEGVYRLPTGGIRPGEKPGDAFLREFREELGFDGEMDRLLGVITHHFTCENEAYDFTSYIYLARESQSEPQPTDLNEGITGFIDVPVSELQSVAEELRNLPGRWRDWGRFRAVAHEVAADLGCIPK